MARSNNVKGVDSLVGKLKARKRSSKTQQGSVIVGSFGVKYAVYVHENLAAYHHVGEAKFLENAYRRNRKQVIKTVLRGFKSGLSIVQSLAAGALLIQRDSMKNTPVDTGNLKGSHEVRIEKQ